MGLETDPDINVGMGRYGKPGYHDDMGNTSPRQRDRMLPSPAAPGRRPPLIGNALDEQDMTAISILDQLAVLETRLMAVLAPIGPTEGVGGAQTQVPKPALPPLIENLNGVTAKMRVAVHQINDLIDRLEI